MNPHSTFHSLARIEKALVRIEAATRTRPAATAFSDSKYQTLRSRTQAALASLETVIAQASGSKN